jgi:hypothetical protein
LSTYSIIRWCLAAVSLSSAIIAHLLMRLLNKRRNGQSHMALCRWFKAVRLYSLALSANLAINAWNGSAVGWSFYLFALTYPYLLYSLLAFWYYVHGRR